ncbi:SDR family NAD(P)-dependent oxidoreductase [Pelagibacterium halotolerans]|uniref:3-hydroxyacyl-CoA dehydrogenase n=1 Tax=Pelagibacterium halotolerans (strain DSM 22347 / JCM 15775 / CGMCC 1.7692 / B2) TaxID=1082931 RepID=G4R888_PELHB|nr:SDR family NAD(P)-dependent oxidoreductase [Pelagibacterium halotolerans]AEQ52332.1 3-hydroxyacyl-CoA dehydrogenase [Pelagibacterium halotolerans B2]QJR17928.1 SDR family NAD(P)-dependent oxidoreductase [Pelagibacterium halotolerans]SEA33533.1 NAD(P)-dependent dehydrogenase, short-chain alcohol dehydrogenase family [Pelagibacterium halotolerans]
MDIAGKTAIVTGAASGLGAATARALAAAGAKVAVFDRDAEKGTVVATEIDGRFFPCDVADAASASAAIADAIAALGTPSILVNCAGIGTAARIVGREGPMPLDAFERVIRVNLVGSFNMMRLAADAMQQLEPDANGQRGVVISTASVAAFEGQIGQAAYAASKGGIVSLTLPAAREFARFGVRVMAIAPGLFLTPLLEELPAEALDALGQSIPNPARLGKPEEFADLVLAMVANDYLNGEVVRLDGALRMAPK